MLHFARDFRVKDQVLWVIQLKGKQTPTLDLFKSNGEKLTSEKISYYEKFSVLQDGSLTEPLDIDDLTFTVNQELAKLLVKGYIVSIDEEYFLVESVNTTTNVVTVLARGYASTPVTIHADNSKVYIISKAEADGEVTEDYKKTNSVEVTNFLQEFTKSINITKRAANLTQKDFASLKGEETANKLNEEGQEMNRTVLYGVPKFDETDGRHSLRGLKSFITSYGGQVLDAEGALTDDKFDFFIAQLAQKGAELDTIICNPMAMNKVFKGLRNTINYTKDAQGNQIAGGVITGYMPTTMGGKQLKFILDTDCREKDIFIVNESDLKFLPVVDKESGEDIVLKKEKETNNSSAVDNATIRTIGTIKVLNPSMKGYITKIF